jgi:hypothetical protein
MNKIWAGFLLIVFFTVGCGKAGMALDSSTSASFGSYDLGGSSDGASSTADSLNGNKNTALEVVLQDTGLDWRNYHSEDYGISKYNLSVKPAWETSPNSKWSDYAADFSQYAAFVIDQEGSNLLKGMAQMTEGYAMCPKYASLSREQKINFWVVFVSEVTRYESGFSPVSRYFESTFTYIDSITGEGVYSEGLLQLSYQDGKSYKGECGAVFDWQTDRTLSRTDPRKTILNPLRNLYCGIRIMDSIVKKKKMILFDSGHYWAVLKPGGKYGKVKQIQAGLDKISFCH